LVKEFNYIYGMGGQIEIKKLLAADTSQRNGNATGQWTGT